MSDEKDELLLEIEAPDEPLVEGETPEATPAVEGGDPEADLDDITFGDEPAGVQDDSAAIRALRAERKRLLKELEDAKKGTVPQTPLDPGPKPTLESCEWDEEKFENDLDAWKERQRAASEHKTVEQQAAAKQQEHNQALLQSYVEKRQALSRSDYQDAEDMVTATIDPLRQSIIVSGAEDPAKLVYALGKNPAKLEALASIADPVKFAIAIGKLEGQLRVVPRKKSPEPDIAVRGSAPVSPATDKHLEKLEADAATTGDRSAVAAYRREQRQKAA